nr:MAG TPA: hypothetical protein [Caudoviricetes sp.]
MASGKVLRFQRIAETIRDSSTLPAGSAGTAGGENYM